MAPDGKSVYAANSFSNTVSQYDVGIGGVLTPKSPPTVQGGGDPHLIVLTPHPRVPTTKDQCKNGGWQNFPQFNNQGGCVSFVENGK